MTLLPNVRHSVKGEQVGMLRVSKFLFIFNLRQGSILIAIQHIALSACALLLLLVGIAHAQEMMEMLNADMEDNAERERESISAIEDINNMDFNNIVPTEASNNQQKFQEAQALAMTMVFMLYACLIATAIYLVLSVGLFYGAAKRRREYVFPWILASSVAIIAIVTAIIVGDNSIVLTQICGGRTAYRFGGAVVLVSHIYCVVAVGSFMYELKTLKDSESSMKLHVDLNEKNSLISQESAHKLKVNSKLSANIV